MPDWTHAHLRQSLIIGHAELVRHQLGAGGVWLQASLLARGKVTWSYCSQDGVSPLAIVRRRYHVRGFTILPRTSNFLSLSVVWYSYSGTRTFDDNEDSVLADALVRLHWLARIDFASDLTVANAIDLRAESATSRLDSLSPTEQRVYKMLCTPMKEVEIAEVLDRSRHTVHVHVKSIYRKLGVNSRRELIRA